jgi:ATP-dependent helicase/nuclease subunit A
LEKDADIQGIDVFNDEFNLLAEQVLTLQRRSFEPQVVELNTALFTVGAAYLDIYQNVKAEQRVFDFADLEWHAWRLLTSEEHAAYLHSRLDARYRHILLDEFQDTNPLQWSIVRAWLDAYGDDASQPSVFIVGDPKQSIYRFRRAEPRVFGAAAALLKSRGARILRTNQTRRNATAIVTLLNQSMAANALYFPQTTLSAHEGLVWRLPLVRQQQGGEETEENGAGFALRDPLTQARAEQDDARRQDEGHAVAAAILQARAALADANGVLPAWSDVMLLVKKRTHLAAYEIALRQAGVPFISDKRGGLLEALEVADLTALLTFLITPGDNRALAHILKSPIFSATDDDLIGLAQRPEAYWWQRLQAAPTSAALQRAVLLLDLWLQDALHLPVHDLLDRILHQGRLVERYAQNAPPLLRSQVIGNLEAFIELALNLDAGRYPSLPKFIDALATLRNGTQNDAPDEAGIDASVDAVRILTIHSAKGLEARIVVLLDTNNSEAARDDLGILCDWPQDSQLPQHFSAYGKRAERGVMRDELFAQEERLKQQEDWNLLYVAATRAKELLVISGVAASRKADAEGLVADNWYARLTSAPLIEASASSGQAPAPQETQFDLALFDPPRLAAAPARQVDEVSSAAIDEGIALHGLLERLTATRRWPLEVPAAAVVARWIGCSLELAEVVCMQAKIILVEPVLERFFNPAMYEAAYNELDVMSGAGVSRFDRFVVFAGEAWVLDYKRRVLASERADYHAQLTAYQAAAQAVYPALAIRAALITVDGRLVNVAELA